MRLVANCYTPFTFTFYTHSAVSVLTITLSVLTVTVSVLTVTVSVLTVTLSVFTVTVSVLTVSVVVMMFADCVCSRTLSRSVCWFAAVTAV